MTSHTGAANDMTQWDAIACQRGPDHEHHTRLVRVDLAKPHQYHDYPQVPARLARAFDLWVWDPDKHPVDNGPYCPAHDAVSATIISHGIWEPLETIFTLAVCDGHEGEHFVDFGAQLGWFSLLASSCDVCVTAIECDTDQQAISTDSFSENGWERAGLFGYRIGPDTVVRSAQSTRLVKIDVEGAESDAIRILWPSIEANLIDFLLVEVSPVFHDGYPAMVAQVVDAGYDAWLLPEKGAMAPFGEHLPAGLRQIGTAGCADRTLAELVASWHQENVVFSREGVEW